MTAQPHYIFHDRPCSVQPPLHLCLRLYKLRPPKCCYFVVVGACVPRRSQRLCQLEFWLLVGTAMLDRLWARGQTKCNTLLMLATSLFGRILLTTLLCDVLVKVQAGHLMAKWRGMHGSCLVPFVMLTPTILWGRVPSWLRWWLEVNSGRCTISPLPATRERKWAGLE